MADTQTAPNSLPLPPVERLGHGSFTQGLTMNDAKFEALTYDCPNDGVPKRERRAHQRGPKNEQVEQLFNGFHNAIENAVGYQRGYLTAMRDDFASFARAALASAQAASAEPVAPDERKLRAGSAADYLQWLVDAVERGEETIGDDWVRGLRDQVTSLRALALAAPAPAVAPAAVTEAERVSGMICQPDGLKFDAFGEPRKRYVRVTLDGSHCVMRPSEGDNYLKVARESGDESAYLVADVWLSEREFDDLGEFNGF